MAEDSRRQRRSESVRDVVLSSEERYTIWCVKVAERPELLEVYQDDAENSRADDDDSDHEEVPLTDGCDIRGWRRYGLMSCSQSLEAVLGVGSGCPLLRRESQLPPVIPSARFPTLIGTIPKETDDLHLEPFPKSNGHHHPHEYQWHQLQARLLIQPLVPPTQNDKEGGVALQRLEPMVMDYATDIQPLYHPQTGRTWQDEPPPFEQQSIPALIHGCTTDWDTGQFTWEALRRNFADVEWRFSDTHAAGMTLRTYDKYCHSVESWMDDAPLAVYDSQFHLKEDPRHSLLNHFSVPACFTYDLFDHLPDQEDVLPHCHDDNDDKDEYDDTEQDDKKEDVSSSDDDRDNDDDNDNNDNDMDEHLAGLRPPYRWVLIGPEFSGTGVHVDPIGTHAWVTLVQGCKRWILFPPETPPETIGFLTKTDTGQQLPSVVWFQQWWSQGRILQELAKYRRKQQEQQTLEETTVLQYVDFLQKPGETIYVPAGWPHLVLNLEPSVAVTQNYATEYPTMGQFCQAVQSDSTPQQLANLRQALQKDRPDLVWVESGCG